MEESQPPDHDPSHYGLKVEEFWYKKRKRSKRKEERKEQDISWSEILGEEYFDIKIEREGKRNKTQDLC